MTTLERFNSLSHLLGAVAATAGTVLLLLVAGPQGDPWRLTSFSIYGASLILLYAASSLSHAHDGSRRGIRAGRYRSQERNRQDAFNRLAALVAAVRPMAASGNRLGSPSAKSNSTAAGTMGTRATPMSRPMPAWAR